MWPLMEAVESRPVDGKKTHPDFSDVKDPCKQDPLELYHWPPGSTVGVGAV